MTRVYIVKSQTTGSTGHFEASDHEEAAEDFAEWSDSRGDYCIVRGEEEKVSVEDILDGSMQHFIVSAESVPVYYARKVTGR